MNSNDLIEPSQLAQVEQNRTDVSESIIAHNETNNEQQTNKDNEINGDQIQLEDYDDSCDDSIEENKDENGQSIEQNNNGNDQEQKLSKNAQKRQKRVQMWESLKLKKKELKKEEKERKRQERQEQMIESGQTEEQIKKPKQIHSDPYKSNQELRDEYSNKAKNGQPIILDMQFLNKLESKEFKSLVKQLCYMQSSNRKSQNPVRFIITSVNDKLRQALYANHADKWGIEILEAHYLDLFPKENLVYLTGDTDQDLDELDKQTAYIIGGLVDHNRLKNVTLTTANEQGICVKRFPIQNYLKLEASSILTCNHVFDIMVKRSNGESWRDSLVNSIPIRKVVATIENGVEVHTEHYTKKLELMKKQQEEALLKKKQMEETGQQSKSEENNNNKENDIENQQNNSNDDDDDDDINIDQEK